jgi:hypothetical protein
MTDRRAGERTFSWPDLAPVLRSVSGADVGCGTALAATSRLAETFREHLAQIRDRPPGSAVLTSATRPEPSSRNLIRIPHLVTVYGPLALDLVPSMIGPGPVADTVIWEVMPRSEVCGWLGGRLPDQRFVEDHLDELLTLKRAVREGSTPDSLAVRELAVILAAGRYVSIRLIYQHDPLFRRLVADHHSLIAT